VSGAEDCFHFIIHNFYLVPAGERLAVRSSAWLGLSMLLLLCAIENRRYFGVHRGTWRRKLAGVSGGMLSPICSDPSEDFLGQVTRPLIRVREQRIYEKNVSIEFEPQIVTRVIKLARVYVMKQRRDADSIGNLLVDGCNGVHLVEATLTRAGKPANGN
jgi:hypothetical protein